ncbi:MAG: hypothetical protein R3C99_12640 [Pirellulaceae bacterium]
MTQGHISRYFGVTRYGRSAVQMAVTAEFADGSSGGAIFNDRGELTGIVSATNQIGNQMVYRTAAPAFLLRRLAGDTSESDDARECSGGGRGARGWTCPEHAAKQR